jgi:hypothetical protein
MMDNGALDRRQFEDMLLFFAQEVGDTAFDRYTSGDLSQEEFEHVYYCLRRWTQETEKLLRLSDNRMGAL